MTLAKSNPATRFPQAVRDVLAPDARYVLMDIGARNGVLPVLAPLADIAAFVGFEPDTAECERLNAENRASGGAKITIYPRAIAARAGRFPFYITRLNHCSGLYPADQAWVGRFPWTIAHVERETEVDAISLADFCAEAEVPRIDFIKIDVEGAEYDVLEGARTVFAPQKVLCILTEFLMDPDIKGQRGFADIDTLLRGHGFRFFDIELTRFPRAFLPAAHLRNATNAHGQSVINAVVDRQYGQGWTGDALYFRDPVLELRQGKLDPAWDSGMLLRLCGLFDLFDYGDCAIEILETFRGTLLAGIDVDPLIDALVPLLDGRAIPYDSYRDVSIAVRKFHNARKHPHEGAPWEPPPTGYRRKG